MNNYLSLPFSTTQRLRSVARPDTCICQYLGESYHIESRVSTYGCDGGEPARCLPLLGMVLAKSRTRSNKTKIAPENTFDSESHLLETERLQRTCGP